jgi:hypothetical protein
VFACFPRLHESPFHSALAMYGGIRPIPEAEGVAGCNFNQTVKVDPALPFTEITGMARM